MSKRRKTSLNLDDLLRAAPPLAGLLAAALERRPSEPRAATYWFNVAGAELLMAAQLPGKRGWLIAPFSCPPHGQELVWLQELLDSPLGERYSCDVVTAVATVAGSMQVRPTPLTQPERDAIWQTPEAIRSREARRRHPYRSS